MHWRRKRQSTSVFLPGESQGRQSLVGCRLWGRTELDSTEATWQQQQQQQIKIHSPVLIAFLLLISLQQGLNTTEQYMPSLNSSSRHALKLLLTALVSDLLTTFIDIPWQMKYPESLQGECHFPAAAVGSERYRPVCTVFQWQHNADLTIYPAKVVMD